VSFAQGTGPHFSNPVRTAEDADRLSVDCVDQLQFVAEAIKAVQERLADRIPLIGFAGAPFTVLSYLVEGGSTRDFKRTKLLLHNEPELAHGILQKIADVTVGYLNMQIAAGADALQLFDSWASALAWDDYRDFAHRYNAYIFSKIDRSVPVISFCKGSSVFAPMMASGHPPARPDVVSVDWNGDLLHVKQALPSGVAVQGNLDPFVLYADKKAIREKIHRLFGRMKDEKGFIFNLGHGIMPDIPFDNVKYAVDVVREYRY